MTKRAEIKQKKTDRLLKTYHLCKEHGGSITKDEDSSKLLTTLNQKQLLSEISYLRLTIEPKIRQQRLKKDKSTGKNTVEKFTNDELRAGIKNALKPEAQIDDSVEVLIMRDFLKC